MSGCTLTGEQRIVREPGRQMGERRALEPRTRSSAPAVVRPFRVTDREAIRRLCCETGFLGKPVEPLFRDRELFADLFTRAYLEYEPECTLVAEANGRVIGYLLGSIRPDFDRILVYCGFQTVSKMLFRLVLGRYAEHARSRAFIRWLVTAGFQEQPRHPRNAAHLHLNVDRRYRGRGVARQLWALYEQQLRQREVSCCYGAFFSYATRRPEAAYARFGFREFARQRTTLFSAEICSPVEVVCVWKQIES